MEITSKYDPAQTEDKWYTYWNDNGFFHSEPDGREAFTIVIPPPNVTGILHMGHVLNNTIQDILVRRARMLGKNACWVPGMDHAAIATEAKVVGLLKERGQSKEEIGREAFLEEAWKWKEKHGGMILEQLKKLGASCDWERTRFTMEDRLSESVIDVFIDLYKKGLIYRGTRMTNWDPSAKTAVSDEEVNHKEVNSKLFYVTYSIDGEDETLTIATTRPETILGDTALCVHPEDERYTHLKGKRALVPLLNRSIPIIQDEYVDMEFGTGCLKVTPAHDVNDHELGIKHQLEVIDIFNEDGTLSSQAQLLIGMDRFVARKEMVKLLEEAGVLLKVEDIRNKVGYSERTDAVIEPRLSKQWFCKMKEMAAPALEVVMNDEVQFHPAKFKNTYRHWMDNIRDWCVSRQLWWGQRIPAWYMESGDVVVAKTAVEAVAAFKEKGVDVLPNALHQDEDVLDTWFSSWLWPISVFDGFHEPDNKDINYYYPTNDLVTGPDIIFFWVARMIMVGCHYRKAIPFKNVYFTGIVRDAKRRKMSKSLGNSPDPLDLIQQYGADGVRVGMLLSAPAGNDLLFDEALCAQGRNFANKVWNAFRLVKGWEIDESLPQSEGAKQAVSWFASKLNTTVAQIDHSYAEFRVSEALMSTYRLVWDEFCSWYLEMVKPEYQQPIDAATYAATIGYFESVLKLLHPFTPFISEELWQALEPRAEGETIMFQPWPVVGTIDAVLETEVEEAKQVITEIRNLRKTKNIPQRNQLEVMVRSENGISPVTGSIAPKLVNASSFSILSEKPHNAFSFVVKADEYFIPLEETIDMEEELGKVKKEMEYTKGFLKAIEGKLNNTKFVSNAPGKVIEMERKKKADAEAKLKALEEQLTTMEK
jgi:valyl-tRNA synthetase